MKLEDLLHLPGALVSQTVRRVSGPRWPEWEASSVLELGDAKAPDAGCACGNADLRVVGKLGTGRAPQLVQFSSPPSPGGLCRQPRPGTPVTERVRSLKGARRPQGRSGRGAARRDPGAAPEARRCSSLVPRSPGPRLQRCLSPAPTPPLAAQLPTAPGWRRMACAVIFPSCREGAGGRSLLGTVPRAGQSGEGAIRSKVAQKSGLEERPWAFSRDVVWSVSAFSGRGSFQGPGQLEVCCALNSGVCFCCCLMSQWKERGLRVPQPWAPIRSAELLLCDLL